MIILIFISIRVKPVSPFPGSRAVDVFPKVFSVDDSNSPNINTVVTVDVCNKALTVWHVFSPLDFFGQTAGDNCADL